MSVGPQSRYNYAAVVEVVDSSGFLIEKEHLDIRHPLVRINYSDNRQLTPSPTDNWSRIAWRTLGDGRRWWIIADFSQILDPLTELQPATKTKYLAQLTVPLVIGIKYSQITVDRPFSIQRGQKLKIEDLDPSNKVSVFTTVLAVNQTTGVVDVSSFTSPGIPAALSRVSHVFQQSPSLVIPTTQRAFFEALDFGNVLNTFVE